MRIANPFRQVLLTIFLITTTLLSGCTDIKIRAGTPVAPSLLESKLTIGKSTSDDIRQILGEPNGLGREFLPFHAQTRTILSYYFEESQVSLPSGGMDGRRIFVWVFLNNGRYDGYLWLSSFPGDRQTP
jgi:hypothetical protein